MALGTLAAAWALGYANTRPESDEKAEYISDIKGKTFDYKDFLRKTAPHE